METQNTQATELEDIEHSSSADLRDRLSPAAAATREASTTASQPKNRTQKFSLSAPALSLIGALALFTTAAIVRSHRSGYKAPSKAEIRKWVDPKLIPGSLNPADYANTLQMMETYHKLREWDADMVIANSRSETPLTDGEARRLTSLLAQAELKSLVQQLAAPTFNTPPRKPLDQKFLYTRPPLIVGVYAEQKLEKGNATEALDAYRTLLSLYPRAASSHGPDSWLIAFAAANEAPRYVQTLASSPLVSAKQLQALLNAMPAGNATTANEDAVRYEATQALPWELANPDVILGELKNPATRARARVDAGATLQLANQAAEEGVQNIRRDWSRQDRTAANRMAELAQDAQRFVEQTPLTSDWLADLFLRRTSPSSKNLLGLLLLAQDENMLIGQAASMYNSRQSYEAARTILGIAVYARLHPSLPRTLDDLLREGIFKQLPTDPYSGEPFLYDRSKLRIRSVGPDGRDNGDLERGDRIFTLYRP